MTKEELMANMDIECPDSEISYDHPTPLLYRIYRMYKELQEYRGGVIFVDDYEDDESSDLAITMTLTSEDQHDGPWAVVTVFKNGSWDTDGYFVDLPLDMEADINEKSEDEVMNVFVRDLLPLV